jgi:hypothetical protein
MFFVDLAPYVLVFIGVVGGVIGICAGVYLAIKGEKNRGWESPNSLIARDSFSLCSSILIFLAFWKSRLDVFWTVILLALVGLPRSIYMLWNDHKYSHLIGSKSPLDLSS